MTRGVAAALALAMFAGACGGSPAVSSPAPANAPAPAPVVAPPPLAPLVTRSPPVRGVVVELRLEKRAYDLGENVVVEYCAVNESTTPVPYTSGGDDRFAKRHQRFRIVATNERGEPMPDPDPEGYAEGGTSFVAQTLGPGERFCERLPLMRYVRFARGGTYALRVTHDCGWPGGLVPQGTIDVGLRMPDAARAAAIVRDAKDFSTLAFDVYLAPLLARAQAGAAEAVGGIASIPSADATRALASLLEHPRREVANAALAGLWLRSPDPEARGLVPRRSPFVDPDAAQKAFFGRFHVADVDAKIREVAARKLASTDVDEVTLGAHLLDRVGTVDDAPRVLGALGAQIERAARVTTPRASIERVPDAVPALLDASQSLVARGHRIDPARSTGELACYLGLLRRGDRPPGWEHVLERAFAHRAPYVQRLALSALPDPITKELRARIRVLLGSDDFDVVAAACTAAIIADSSTLRADVSAALARTSGDAFASAACGAARESLSSAH